MKIEIYIVSQVPPALTLTQFTEEQVAAVVGVATDGQSRFMKVWDDEQTTLINLNNVTMIRVTED